MGSSSSKGAEPLFAEGRLGRWTRRALSIPGLVVLTALYLALSPLWLPGGAAIDLLLRRHRWLSTRCLLALAFNLVMHVWALIVLTALGVVRAPSDWYFRLEIWWARTIFEATLRLFDMRTEVEGEAAVASSPLIVFSRHVSILDAMIPVIFAGQHGIHLRAVMKRELLWDPCVDILGHHAPSAFVRRYTKEHAPEIASVGRLLDGLGPGDGLMMFPEGTRASEEKQSRVLRRLEKESSPHLERARALRHLLPPRLGGPVEILRRNPGCDLVWCGHTGLEGFNHLKDLFRGHLLGQTIRVEFWRVPFADIPTDDELRVEWLFDQWQRIDDWVEATQGAPAPHRI